MSAEFDVLPACKQNNINILAYSSLQQGLLTGRFSTVDEVPMGPKLSKLFNASWYVKI
jgi:aryl-alcohol dehydrogenase-like predicted oxidoreductase